MKVTKGNPHSPEVKKSQARSKEGSEVKSKLTRVAMTTAGGAEIFAVGGRRSVTGRDLTGFRRIMVSTSSKEVGLGLGVF